MERGGKTPWELKRGPFKASLFSKLPKTHWTVLVNGVDRFVPAINGLLDHFSFVPFWRIDDVMISVACDKGNVGAHVDNYDVFLVQAHGTREWLIEDSPRTSDEFKPGLPIRLLKRFKPTHRWVLEPGDILYLPPRFPHHGIARGDNCMTISVGFRAPSVSEIINGVVTEALGGLDDSLRYTDSDLKAQQPGEISTKAVDKIKRMISKELLNDALIESWLARYVTESYPDVELQGNAKRLDLKALRGEFAKGRAIVRCEGARLAFIESGRDKQFRLYANGTQVEELKDSSTPLARAIANRIVVGSDEALKLVNNQASLKLLSGLISRGLVVIE
jgi:50S ribosomal protein L16 3-hydroxylase